MFLLGRVTASLGAACVLSGTTATCFLPVRSANAQETVRPIPPPGVAISDTDRAELTTGVAALGREITALQTELKSRPALLHLLPDVQIYEKAVRWALTYNEFYDAKEAATAKTLLAQGMERAKALRAGDTPWTRQTGLVALGYVSRIDGSIQPYGLVVPPTWAAGDMQKRRLDVFCHGRGEKLTELSFIDQRQKSPGDFMPPDAFVLHPYGRYCNANRFAGEVDLFEALADIKTRYKIDEDRLVMRGFSMGGASAWQYAVHFPGTWAAATPGAGFSETVGFLNLLAPGKPPLPPWEQSLLHWYDATDWAANLSQLPTVAYNGDKDGQKQAADKMQEAMQAEGLTLTRVVGKDAGHWYTADGKKEIDERISPAVTRGRDNLPPTLRFTTWTLRYPTLHWLTVTGMGRHWERARVSASLSPDTVTVQTENVTRFQIAPQAARKTVIVNGQKLVGLMFAQLGGKWVVDKNANPYRPRKKPGLQGPIDDAFCDAFVFVRPTGTPLTPATGTWTQSEMNRAAREWRATFRGDAPIADDTQITDTDIRGKNLVLWGDPSSNKLLARIAAKLPIQWAKDGSIRANNKTYAAAANVPVFIFPNPLNPSRYVVINSGTTWREAAYLNNAQQRSRLPDWAIIDITTPPDANAPGKIVDAGFFNEQWQWRTGDTSPVAVTKP